MFVTRILLDAAVDTLANCGQTLSEFKIRLTAYELSTLQFKVSTIENEETTLTLSSQLLALIICETTIN